MFSYGLLIYLGIGVGVSGTLLSQGRPEFPSLLVGIGWFPALILKTVVTIGTWTKRWGL